MYRRILESEEHRVIIDPISLVCIFGTFMVLGIMFFAYVPDLGTNPIVLEIVIKSVGLMVLLSGGLVGMLFMGIYDPARKGDTDWILDAKEIDMIILWTGISLMMIFMINYVTFQNSTLFQQATAIDPKALMNLYITFTLAAGWTEEIFFRGFLLRAIQKFTLGDEITAIVVSTLAWWGFHWGVYGLDLNSMIVILFSGFFLSLSMIMTRGRLSVTMLPHGLNNLFSALTQGSILMRIVFILRLVR